MLTFMLKSDSAYKLVLLNAKFTILGTFFSRKDISPVFAYNEMVAH